jgi:hypothetical protein
MVTGDNRGGAKVFAASEAWSAEPSVDVPGPGRTGPSAGVLSVQILQEEEGQGLLHKFRTATSDSLPNRGAIDAVDVSIAGYAFPLALLFHTSFLFFLIYVTLSEYNSLVNEKFLSPEVNSGSMCESIPVANNADFGIDLMGQWDNSKDFNFTSSIYTLSFKGLDVSEEEYYEIIELHRKRLEALSGRASHRDLGYELIALSSFTSKAKVDMFLNTEAELVFNIPIRGVTYSDSKSKKIFTGSYNKGSSELTIILDSSYSYYDLFSSDVSQSKSLVFDIRSVSTAIAVNLGITGAKDLEVVAGLPVPGGPKDFVGDMAFYVDSHYGDMAPILCYSGSKKQQPDVCLVRSPEFEKAYMFPMIFQVGNTNTGRSCDCDGLDPGVCNSMEIAINFLVFPQVPGDPYLKLNSFLHKFVSLMRLTNTDADKDLTSLLHRAYSAAMSAQGNTQSAVFQEMCSKNCSMVSVLMLSSTFPTLNYNGMQFTNLYEGKYEKCKDVIFKGNLFQRMKALPPASLIESYYICQLTSSMAIQRAIGVAAGTSSLYASIILTGTLSFFVTWYNKVNGKGSIPTRRSKQLRLQRQLDLLTQEVEQLKQQNVY